MEINNMTQQSALPLVIEGWILINATENRVEKNYLNRGGIHATPGKAMEGCSPGEYRTVRGRMVVMADEGTP